MTIQKKPVTKPTSTTPTPRPPTTEQVLADQKRMAERDRAARAVVPAPTKSNGDAAVAVPDNRTPQQRYLDEIAPASIVGRMIKFDGKGGRYVTPDDDQEAATDVDYIALCDQTIVGFVKFNGEGMPPDRHMGLLYDSNFVEPERETLGDNDPTQWETGLDGQPQDPWQHHVYLVLQRGDTAELFTFVTNNKTGRRAAGSLLKHYARLQKTHPDMFPVIRLKVGGFNHRDERVGWVHVPVLATVGRAPKDSAAKPDGSMAADMDDQIPF